jgi:hypothetical protein
MTASEGQLTAQSAVGRSTRERALRAYAEAKRRVVGRTSMSAGPVVRAAAMQVDQAGRLLRRPRP